MVRNKFISKTSAAPDVSTNIHLKEKNEDKQKENDFNKELKEQN